MMKWIKALLALALVFLIAIGAIGAWAWNQIEEPYPVNAEVLATHPFEVAQGSSARSILDELHSQGLIANADLARIYLVHRLGDPPLRAGEYAITLPATTPEVLDKLIRGDVVLHPVTILEGLTGPETAELLASSGFGDLDKFLELVAEPAPISDLDPEAPDLEGYLFPDTYSFPRGASEEEVILTLVRTFKEKVRPILEQQPGALTLRQLATLGSIVEKEAQLDEERPIIAAVYQNRLDQGIGLYADPTVIFALKKAGTWDGNIRKRDLSIVSPYNTYKNAGLPPGPIASAGAASLLAAANPADVDFLYFVSRNDGSHVFAKTLREHNRNVNEWQRKYWRQRR